jgi:hypothetical protein
MRSRIRLSGCAAVLTCGVLAVTSARADWNETVRGDLSDQHNQPTSIALVLPTTLITGRMGSDPVLGGLDADIFTFSVPAGSVLTALDLSVYVPSAVVGGGAFFALSAGTTIDPNDADAHLGNLLVSQPGALLPLLATPTFGGPGVFGPLEPGDYTVWFQETVNAVDYQFALTLTPIPEPGAAAVLAPVLLLLARRGRRKA